MGVFVCYRRKPEVRGTAGRLRDALDARLDGVSVFMDVDSLSPGDDWPEAIDSALSETDVFLAVIHPDWVADDRVTDETSMLRHELESALGMGLFVIPVLIEGAAAPGEDELPAPIAMLAHKQAIELHFDRWQADVSLLVETIRKRLQPRKDGLGDDPAMRLREGFHAAVDAVRPGFGPGDPESFVVVGDSITPPDGISIVESLKLEDALLQAGVDVARHIARAAIENAGDGTTTALLVADGILSAAVRHQVAGTPTAALKKGIEATVRRVVDYVADTSAPLADRDAVAAVASTAAGDRNIGEVVADAIDRVGLFGVVTIDDGLTFGIELEFFEGMRMDQGFISPHFVTDPERHEAVLENPYVVLAMYEIEAVSELLPVVELVKHAGKPLLVVAEDVQGDALAMLVVNNERGTVASVAVGAPDTGERRKGILQDIAILTGGQVFSKEVGFTLDHATLDLLGTAGRVVVTKHETTILDGGGSKSGISARIAQINSELAVAESDEDRDHLQLRMARLAGGAAIVRAGASSDAERREQKRRLVRAFSAARAAMEGGVVPGAGAALLAAKTELEKRRLDREIQPGADAVFASLAYPAAALLEASGFDPATELGRMIDAPGCGYDLTTGRFGNLAEAGIIDATKTVIAALDAAGSGAVRLLTARTIRPAQSTSGR